MALTQLAQHPSKPNRSDSARPQSPRPTLCNCSLTALSNSPTSAGLYPHQVPQLTGKPGMPSGTGSTGPLLSPRLHYYTQAACPRRSPQAARGQPGRPPLAHHKPSPGPTGKGSPRRLGEVAPGAGGGRPRSPPHPTLRARVRPSSRPAPLRPHTEVSSPLLPPAPHPAPPAPAPAPPRNRRPWRRARAQAQLPPRKARRPDWLQNEAGPAAPPLLAAGQGACALLPWGREGGACPPALWAAPGGCWVFCPFRNKSVFLNRRK